MNMSVFVFERKSTFKTYLLLSGITT